MTRFIGLLLLNFITTLSFAQTFKGTVEDATGNPIPYATIYIREMQSGFTTDEHGQFQTKLPKGQYTSEVSSLGFTSQAFSFQMPGHDYEKNLILSERVYSLPEVNITKGGEDPAYSVMRKAIARAPYHRTQVKSFTAGTYIKGTGKCSAIPALLKISKDVRKASKELLGRLFVLEEQQLVSFTAPNTWNNRVVAYRNSFPVEMQIKIGLTDINFYAPEVLDKVSPLNKSAFLYYRFRLDGFFSEGGYLINKIRVIPKREDSRLLEGDIFIVEDLWCVSAADFRVRESGLKGHFKVTCKEVQPSVFLPISTALSTSISTMGFKVEASYLSAVHYTDVKVDIKQAMKTDEATKAATATTHSMKKRKYERASLTARRDIQTDSLADNKDSLYWNSVRSVPLQLEEMQSYLYKDEKILRKDSLSVRKVHKKTVVGQVVSTLLWGKTFRTADKKAWITLPNLTKYIPEYNFVDGFWLGVKLKTGLELSPSSTLHFTPSLYYTTARRNWLGQGELALDYAPLNRGQLSLSGGVVSADYNSESGESRLLNAFSSAFFGHNHIKLYEKTFLTVDHSIEPCNGLLFNSSLSWQRRKTLSNQLSHSWFKRAAEPNIPRNDAYSHIPDNDILKASFGLEYTPAHYYHLAKGRKVYEASRYPTFLLQYDRAFPINDSRYLTSYHLMQFSARQEVKFGMFNRLRWSVNAGSFWNVENMQFVDFKHFATTDIFVMERTFNSGFSLLDNYALSTGTRWAQVNISWYTPYLLLKQLPFLAKKPFDEALHLRSIVVYGQHPYTELGYSIGFSDMARVGVFAGFDRLKYRSVGISVSLPLSLLIGK